ncbi:unnamed protein product [Phaedon cochleariae]|uniref:Uncharacterized protein n=1 Tax=Phaedon cochleariae TaxID=80249 RepID=A0A9P0DRW4_PHACE|nr:unnamed protein product [Phaedon cochleariae]
MEEPDKSEEICRLCDDNSEKMFSIFDKNEEGIETLQLIKECLQIIIYRTDPLSKQICESCLESLDTLSKFRRNAEEIAEKQRDKLRSSDEANTRVVQLFLQCGDITDESSELKDASTSTEDLTVLCKGCKKAIRDGSEVNGEVELCTDLHKAIAESMVKNEVASDEKSLRKRKVVPFYHELDDSICSSLTEYNTEGSQGLDEPSDSSSSDSDEAQRPTKRRRIESGEDEDNDSNKDDESNKDGASVDPLALEGREGLTIRHPDEINGEGNVEENGEENEEEVGVENSFADEEEIRYQPLTLLMLALNAINVMNVPDYEPDEYTCETIYPECNYCGARFQNYKMLAVHEVGHLDVEMGDKIDNPIPWHSSRDDAEIRNKWLTFFDENGYEDDDIVIDEQVDVDVETVDPTASNLLVPVPEMVKPEGTSGGASGALGGPVPEGQTAPKLTGEEKIVLAGTQPTVNGFYLGDYAKDDRKLLYQSMRIAGVNKKFCTLCRYTFKDNWAIESHYFSLACFYTCRYCGMRFNKQRHKFEEHVDEHKAEKHEVSAKVYAASKLSNVIPKVLHPPKPRRIVVTQHNPSPEMFGAQGQNSPAFNQQMKMKNVMERRSLQPNLQIKEEPQDSKDFITSQSKSGNQAYFCRKCYKVFFKLDEFNIHSKNCDFHQFPARNSGGRPNFGPPKNGEVSPAGRPMRNCTKEIGPYKDEVYLPDSIMREKEPRQQHVPGQSFVCFICNTPFPTIYSRNSHMRIHKGEMQQSPMPQQQGPPPSYKARAPQASQNNHMMQNYRSPAANHQPHHRQQLHSPIMEMMEIKQEPMDAAMEPMVEIYEPEQPTVFPESLGDGAVSITPISKNPNKQQQQQQHRGSLGVSNVMRMVQGNSQLSIKKPQEKMQQQQMQVPSGSSSHAAMAMGMGMIFPDPDRTYKCSSCWEAFANKSHLYFHKKNQCEGSRLPCPFCKKRFGTEAEYSSHIYYSHPE